MSRLLHAGYWRLRKSKVYGAALISVLLYCVFGNIMQYSQMVKYEYPISFEETFFNYLPLIGVVMSVWVSMFVGTEYSDGTIRNKLIIGLPRNGIYVSNFMICTVGGLAILSAAYILGAALGIPLFGTPDMTIPQLFVTILKSFCFTIAYISIFNMITMLNSSKTNAAVICILLAFALIFMAIMLYSELSKPEYFENLVIKDGVSTLEMIKNPNYLTGMKREIYQNLLELLPSGQSMLSTGNGGGSSIRMILYSGLITFVTNIIGVFTFKKKDFK